MNNGWQDFLAAHWGKIIGGTAGLFIAVMVAVFGFWLTLFIIFCVTAGIILGSKLEKHESFKSLWQNIWPPNNR